MGFFENLDKKITETTNSFQETTNRIERQNKCKKTISENKTKIDNYYKEIGERIYNTSKIDKNVETFIENKKKEITKLLEENESLHIEVLKLDNKKICINCGNEMQADMVFCPKCGKEQEKVPEGKVRCQNCGKIIDKKDAFCLNCGKKNSEFSADTTNKAKENGTEKNDEKKIEE